MIKLNPSLQNSNISTANSLIFNSLKIVINVLFPFMIIPYISRILSVEQIGIYNWDLSIINYLAVMAGLSLPIIGIKEIGLVKKDPKKISLIINNIFIIKFITIFIASIIILGVAYFQKVDGNGLVLIILSLIMIIEIFAHEWVYVAFGDHKSILFRNFISKIILLICTFTFIKSEDDFLLFIVIYTISAIIPFIISYKYLFINFKPQYINLKDLKYINISTLKSFSISLLMAFYGKIDVVILGFILSSKELGIFTSAYKLVMLALVFITTWSMVLLPKSSQLYQEDEKRYIEFISKSLDLVLVFGLFVTITLIMYSKNIVLLIFGDKFYEAYYMINYLAPITVLLSLYNVFIFQILYIKNKYEKVIKFYLFIYIIFIGLILLDIFNLEQILFSILLMNIIQFIYTWYLVNQIYVVRLFDNNKIKIYSVTVFTISIFFLITRFKLLDIIDFGIYLMISSIFYFGLLVLLKENISSLIFKKLKGK